MTKRILKSSISVLDAFNAVRNNQTLAHANEVINDVEAELIVSHVAGSVRFINAVEASSSEGPELETDAFSEEDLPY
jgi:isopentenyl phosphate kinase